MGVEEQRYIHLDQLVASERDSTAIAGMQRSFASIGELPVIPLQDTSLQNACRKST
jgi:hypothetical protein